MDKEKKVRVKNMTITILVIIMFAGIILGFYNMLYAEKRNSLLKDGKTSTEKAADEVNDYLSTSMNAIKLTGYSLDSMISNGRSHEDIQEYLEGQSVAVISTVFENSKGIYGYINGQYHDGTRWEPDDDYVPTERPWYIKAMQRTGNVVLVDPYVDAQTGNVMMSIAKSLRDNQSVVAMDIYLDKLQEITEDAVESAGADMAFILDSQNMVISHSDKEEVWKHYSDDNGSIGAEIVKKISGTEGGFFELKYNGTDYIVYTIVIRNDWKCVSVLNASTVFTPLKIILFFTIVAVFAVIIIISLLMMNRTNKQLLAEKLSSQLSSTADIYVSLHEIDLLKGTVIVVRDNNNDSSEIQEQVITTQCQEYITKGMTEYTDESCRSEILDFVDLNRLDQRLKAKNTITMEFLNAEKKWCRARFIVSDRTPTGRITNVMFLIEDIDDERKARNELISMSEQALAASEAKSSFLSNMSHEIRTPINAVLGMNEMILRESTDDNITGYAANIKTAGNSLLGLINDILDFSKIEAGKMEIIPVEYNIANLINDLVNMIQSRADAKSLQLMLEMDKNIPKMLRGDEVRIKQVITNILTNAVKYTAKGSVIFGINAEKIPEDGGSVNLCVSIKDTGMGIKQEDIKKLFSEFVRIDEKKNRNIEGTGLGMNITQSLLQMMGSNLEVESIYGLGSKFSFRLRQEVLDWEPLGDYEKAYKTSLAERKKYKEKFVAPKAKVLVVDDNEMNRIVFQSLVKKTLIQVDAAVNGDDGLSFTRKKKYDIIFLDHLMPEKDGIETLKELKGEKDNPNLETPVICLTANAITGAREQYFAAGFDDYLTKPIDADELENLLMKYLPDDIIETSKDKAEDGTEAKSEAKTGAPEGDKELSALSKSCLIDIKTGIKNSGSVDAYMPILKVFYESIGRRLKELRDLYEEEDYGNYTARVQALKSSLMLIGAGATGQKAKDLEDAGKAGDVAFIRQHHEEFVDSCERLRSSMDKIFEQK